MAVLNGRYPSLLPSCCTSISKSLRIFFFSFRRQKRKEIICEKHIHSLESYSKWKWTHHFNSPMGGKKIPWPRIDSRSPGLGNGNQIPVLLHGKLHRQRNLAGYRPWGQKELDMTEHKHTQAGRTCSNSCFLGTVTGLYYGQKQKFTGLTISSNSLFFFFRVLWTYSL